MINIVVIAVKSKLRRRKYYDCIFRTTGDVGLLWTFVSFPFSNRSVLSFYIYFPMLRIEWAQVISVLLRNLFYEYCHPLKILYCLICVLAPYIMYLSRSFIILHTSRRSSTSIYLNVLNPSYKWFSRIVEVLNDLQFSQKIKTTTTTNKF